MDLWILPLTTALLAGLFGLASYFGIFREKKQLEEEEATSRADCENRVKSGVRVDAEEEEVKISAGCSGHLYLRPDTRAHLLLLQHRDNIQSSMQLSEGRIRDKTSSKDSIMDSTRSSSGRSGSSFQWPQGAPMLEGVRKRSSGLDSTLEDKLKGLGIFRGQGAQGQKQEVKQEEEEELAQSQEQRSLECAARVCGRSLPRRHVWVTFDNFLAKSRPGLESEEEIKELSPKPKKTRNRRNNNNNNTKKKDDSLSWHDDKENKTIKTTGWDNPAWKTSYTRLIPPQSAGLIRAA
jgi:hypothetical protein